MKVYDIINNALTLIGISADGTAPHSYEMVQGLQALNIMLSAWSGKTGQQNEYFNESFTAPEVRKVVSLGSTSTITGDIATRPTKIDQVSIIQGNIVWNVGIISFSEYMLISMKDISTISKVVAWDNGNPISNLYFWPAIPQGYSIQVIGTKAGDSYLNLTDDILQPPDFLEAIVYNLAVRCALIFGITVDPQISQIAHSGNKIIKRNVILNKSRKMNNYASYNENLPTFNYITGLNGSGR